MKWQVWKLVKRLFISEWQKKLGSIFIAVLAWYYVNSLSQIQENFSVPIQYKNLPSGMIILESEPDAHLVVKGNREQLKKLNISKSVKALVSLDQATNGTDHYKIEMVINNSQQDLIFNFTQDQVKVTLDYMIEKSVLVKPYLVGQPEKGYKVDEIISDHEKILLSGPMTVLNQLSEVPLKPFSIEGLSNTVSVSAELALPKNTVMKPQETIILTVKISPL